MNLRSKIKMVDAHIKKSMRLLDDVIENEDARPPYLWGFCDMRDDLSALYEWRQSFLNDIIEGENHGF